MNKLELLKTKLQQARKELNDKGYHYDPEMYDKQGYDALMNIKPFEIKYQDVIEEIWPDEAWWKVTNYWDIFDAMAFGGLNDETVIDEICNHVDRAFLDEACKIEENLDKELKELETKYDCKFEEGHTHAEYEDEFGDEYANGELWDYSIEDIKSGAVEPQKGLVYWLICDKDDELRVFETLRTINESKELKEGTSNFGWLRKFPLLVFYTWDEIDGKMRYAQGYPEIEQFTTDKGNGDFHVDYDAYYDALDKFEQDYWDNIDTCVLNEDDLDGLEDAIYNFNEETKQIANDLWDAGNEDDYYVLKDIKLKVEPGYYEAAYIDVDDEKEFDYLSDKVKEEQLKRFHDFFDKLKKDFGLSHYEVAWGPASNGETGYKKVESCKEKKLFGKVIKEAYIEDDLKEEIEGMEERGEIKPPYIATVWYDSYEDYENEQCESLDELFDLLEDDDISSYQVEDDNGKFVIEESLKEDKELEYVTLRQFAEAPAGTWANDYGFGCFKITKKYYLDDNNLTVEEMVHADDVKDILNDVEDLEELDDDWLPLNEGVFTYGNGKITKEDIIDFLNVDIDEDAEDFEDEYECSKKEFNNFVNKLLKLHNQQESLKEEKTKTLVLNKEYDLDYTNPEESLEEYISNYLSKEFGCACEFGYLDNGENVNVYDIKSVDGFDLDEAKKKDCHVNTNAGDPIKNAEFFNASMGVSMGEDLEEALSVNDFYNGVINVIETYIEDCENEEDDTFAGTEDSYAYEVMSQNLWDLVDALNVSEEKKDTIYSKLLYQIEKDPKGVSGYLTIRFGKKDESVESENKEQVTEGLVVNSNDTQVAVHDDSTVEVISDGGSVTVANGEVNINAGETEVVVLDSGDTTIEVNKVEEVVPEVGVEVTPEAEATAELIDVPVEASVVDDATVSTPEDASVEIETQESLKEGYIGQTVEDFLGLVVDPEVIETLIISDIDAEDYDENFKGIYDELDDSIKESDYADFDVGGNTLVINASEDAEDAGDFYQTVEDLLEDYNGDLIEVQVDGETKFSGDKSDIEESVAQLTLVSIDAPKYLCINAHLDGVDESLKENKLNEEPVYNLDTRYDTRDSFYGKAKVDVRGDGSQILYSYGTPVCIITKDGDVKLLRKGYLGWFSSQTTLRHVKEFLKQNGKEIGTKNELNKMYPTEDAYDYVR